MTSDNRGGPAGATGAGPQLPPSMIANNRRLSGDHRSKVAMTDADLMKENRDLDQLDLINVDGTKLTISKQLVMQFVPILPSPASSSWLYLV